MRRHGLLNSFDLLNDFGRGFPHIFSDTDAETGAWIPQSRYKNEDQYYQLSLDIPGVTKEKLSLELNENILTIAGERENVASFSRQFQLPKDANLDELEANHENGVLDILIPKFKAEEKTRRIQINTGKSKVLENS